MNRQRTSITLGLMLGALASTVALGCATTTEEAESTDAFRLKLYATGGWGGCHNCGYKNSPYLGPHNLSDFTLAAYYQGGGLMLQEIEDLGGNRYAVGLDQDALEAYTPGGVVTGVGLVGWKLIFTDPSIPSFTEKKAEIFSHLVESDWVNGDPIDTYGLAYQKPVGPGEYVLEGVCGGLGLDDTNVVFIADETYDQEYKEVHPGKTGMVTVACRGHAIAKMRFMGHSPNDQYGSAPEQRQATLKMLTADYCGTGESHTTQGQPLAWADSLGLFAQPSLVSIEQMEARWDDSGAVCLYKPRNPDVDRSDVDCVIPLCEGDPADLENGLWASYYAP